MSDPPQLGAVPQRIAVDPEQVRRLIADQFPQWADLPVQPVVNGGWDNWTFHLGSRMSVRLPSASEYALAVEKEHRWLPALAPRLPLPVPAPLAKGEPGAGYPYSWSIYQWLDGEAASTDRIADPVRFAADLAGFLAALQSVDTTDGPRPGQHNWYRGGTLRTYDGKAQRALTALDGRVDIDLAREIWKGALDASWDGAESWFHGDIASGNLLLNDGQLAAVIDFGTCGVGDPACDLAIAWTLLTADGRQTFRERLSVDDATWTRGRGWALWKTLVTCAYSLGDADEPAGDAPRVLGEIFAEYAAGAATKPTP
ncbi:aminoglycoside phosphotransferase family protein [Plantactinospora soyae]|uniref:Aminoglycoside phosphotransferase (APT) family kinase protein n=1 Tax=Plantactinospora soyae TaxID=1544732 RepID=A0A927MAA8_9ACTN|nr:aminoglycoside phosphotransferase family protein [Plantactinospora soyae]MBE1490897.1 aminoglycoside phosphotransferase (APT) family kinase protein [Plantactinospora soyae]